MTKELIDKEKLIKHIEAKSKEYLKRRDQCSSDGNSSQAKDYEMRQLVLHMLMMRIHKGEFDLETEKQPIDEQIKDVPAPESADRPV